MRTMIYHIFVSGRVQGVGYRRFAQKQAKAMKIEGWTRNLLDGRVEVIAKADEKQLEVYCESLKKGPSFSAVREVVVKEIEASAVNPALQNHQFNILPDVELK